MQQAGRNPHLNICESLELFARTVMPKFQAEAASREARKAASLAPHLEAAVARKRFMPPIAREDVPVVPAAVKAATFDALAAARKSAAD